MHSFKKFLRAKKGAHMLEIILLIPFFIFLITYSAATVYSFAVGASIQETTTTYVRKFVTEKTLKEGFESVINTETYDDSVRIIEVNLISIDENNHEKRYTLNIGDKEAEVSNFKAMFEKNGSGYYTYKMDNTVLSSVDFDQASELYKLGTYVEIKTKKNINKFLKSLFVVDNWIMAGQKTSYTYGIANKLYASGKNIVIG